MKILFLDKNHPLLLAELSAKGFLVDEDYSCTYADLKETIHLYHGIVIRSRLPIDGELLEAATELKFIARVGAGMENIDTNFAAAKGIRLINAPEGNRDAVAEHVVGSLLSLLHRLIISAEEVKRGQWEREKNRGDELSGKTVGLIGYGNMGKVVARRFSGFGVKVIFHDILPDLSDDFGEQVSLETLQKEADVLSLHVPLTPETKYLVNERFIAAMAKDFYLINTARGQNVDTSALVSALQCGKVRAAALDVLEYEKSSFENLDTAENPDLAYLLQAKNVLITPHIAGWSHQSNEKLARTIVEKIVAAFG